MRDLTTSGWSRWRPENLMFCLCCYHSAYAMAANFKRFEPQIVEKEEEKYYHLVNS